MVTKYAKGLIFRFEKDLAAEALRKSENDSEKALDDLTNPETNSSIQVFGFSWKWFNFKFWDHHHYLLLLTCSLLLNQRKGKDSRKKWMLQFKL